MKYLSKTAEFSICGRYRYGLSRSWNDNKKQALFVGLNPSTADNKIDDPTIRKCVRFADSWGYGSIEIVNLFAYKATHPKNLFTSRDPIGPENDYWIKKAYTRSDIAIACWGSFGSFQERSTKVAADLVKLHCLAINNDEEPTHPLYLSANLKPIPYAKIQSI